MVERTIRIPAWHLFLRICLLIVGACLIAVVIHDGVSRPVQVELPKGYRGWVVVKYEDPSCPRLGRRGLFLFDLNFSFGARVHFGICVKRVAVCPLRVYRCPRPGHQDTGDQLGWRRANMGRELF